MKRSIVVILLVLILVVSLFGGCSAPAVMIPSQSGLADGVEYMLVGQYDTGSIGTAVVECKLFYTGEYEIKLTIYIYSSYASWGTWTYDKETDTFNLVDTENNMNFVVTRTNPEAVEELPKYSTNFVFNKKKIELSAEMDGQKDIKMLNVDPNAAIGGVAGAQFEFYKVEKDGNKLSFYDNGVFEVFVGEEKALKGAYKYAIGELTFTANEKETKANANGQNLSVSLNKDDVTYLFDIDAAEFSYAVANGGIYTKPNATIADKYSATTEEDWAKLWENPEITIEDDAKLVDLPKTSLDGTFEDTLPKEYFTPVSAEKRGTVSRMTYQTYVYDYYYTNNVPESEWQKVTKPCYVYLPYNYDESKQYNVYYLMHGAGGDETNWFTMNCGGESVIVGEGDFVVLADYLIANGLMEPTIFVSVTTNTEVESLDRKLVRSYSTGTSISSFPYELENDIIPAVESKYSTFAKTTDKAGLIESRYHRAFSGLSMGSYITWNTMNKTIDVMAYYGPLANGCDEDKSKCSDTIVNIYNEMCSEENSAYPVGFIFSDCGMRDHTWDAHTYTINGLYEVAKDGDSLVYGENYYHFNAKDGTHTAKYFILGAYNSMKVFFKQ